MLKPGTKHNIPHTMQERLKCLLVSSCFVFLFNSTNLELAAILKTTTIKKAGNVMSPLLVTSELYIYGRLTSVNCVIKKCNTKWRKLKAFLGVIFSPLTCAVKYFCKFLFGFLWRKVFRNGFFPF